MKKNLRLRATLSRTPMLLICFAVAALTVQAQGAQLKVQSAANPCVVEIQSPDNGDRVNKSIVVRGRALLPATGFLWVLVQMDGFDADSWWPQPGPVRIDKDGNWKAVVFVGREEDVGNSFVIAAVAVDGQRNGELKRWLSTSKQRDYQPMNFPEPLAPCSSIPKVTVEKRGH